ncbi:MAG: DEAD/DEAH box helicase family protein [Clostridia bacterium]|nr:DEAD/DEAH box helicase family protein [Clostridia bacterium]
MTENMHYIVDTVTATINRKYGDELPTLEQINAESEIIRKAFSAMYPVSDDDFAQIQKVLATNILHTIGVALTLRGRDSEHQSWYYVQENDGFYWKRYKTYLKSVKHWGIDVVNRLNKTSSDVMDDLGNPKDYNRPFQRRGLLLGDVQSGKTATYTAICNKASDAGYRVIIVLAGMMENLRVQTQERLDAEFVGVESKYTLDKKADNEIKNKPVGVGKIPPNNPNKRIACFTSVATDFNKTTLRALGLSLRTLNGTALFVVKKNKSVLNNLYKWLMENNADYENGLIDLPLLLIDDEADNASVNTNSEEKDPTAINKAIRNILNCFKQASYLGITATPFANIFIDPEAETDEAAKDLFPKDFLTVLPTPELYIGSDKIFGNGDADDWEKETPPIRCEGIYGKAIIPIKNEEQDSFFVFKHKKDLADDLYDIPYSMKQAIRYFMLITAISDLRKDTTEHRSMLVNVSRFTLVQNKTADLIEDYVDEIKADLENYSSLSLKKAMKIKNIALLFETWNEYDLEEASGINWETFLRDYLFKSVKRIEVRSVNQQHGASSLNYFDYKNIGMRVIAVGGNSLSRGLTLEGLCVSYFYRNTMMYDTLLQMGRWFGYRPNYDDLFKVWMGEDAIDWYGYITDAVNELKDELRKMERQNQTPEEFGLKVRQAPGSLLITARNKMRTATSVSRPITVSGRMIETPRLKGDKTTLSQNEDLCRSFIKSLSANTSYEYDANTKSYIWHNIPKNIVIDLVRGFSTHPWNLNFQPIAIADYIYGDNKALDYWDVAIPQGSENAIKFELFDETIEIKPEGRQLEWDKSITNLIRVNGHHVRVGTGGCSKIGLKKEKIDELRASCKANNEKVNDRTYLIKDRNPIALIHVLKNTSESRKPEDPDILFALGLGFPKDGLDRQANYMVNVNELKNWVDITDEDDE